MAKQFKIKLKRSLIGCSDTQRKTVEALGLRKREQEKIVVDTPQNRGQIYKVQHLLDVTPL